MEEQEPSQVDSTLPDFKSVFFPLSIYCMSIYRPGKSVDCCLSLLADHVNITYWFFISFSLLPGLNSQTAVIFMNGERRMCVCFFFPTLCNDESYKFWILDIFFLTDFHQSYRVTQQFDWCSTGAWCLC